MFILINNMQNNNVEKNEEIFDYPEDYENIANLALLNFEKSNKIDLDKLIQKNINVQFKNINDEINNMMNENLNNNENEIINLNDKNNKDKEEGREKDKESNSWGEDDDNEDDEKFNKYQVFEDENEERDIMEEKNENKENKNNETIFSNIVNSSKINEKELNNNENLEIHTKINGKLTIDEIKNKLSKINFSAPDWAMNLSNEEFIKKAKEKLNHKNQNFNK